MRLEALRVGYAGARTVSNTDLVGLERQQG